MKETHDAIARWIAANQRECAGYSWEVYGDPTAVLNNFFGMCGSGFTLLTLWMILPGTPLAATWTGFALLLFAIDSRFNLNAFAWISAGVLGAAYVRLLTVNFRAWNSDTAVDNSLIASFVIVSLYWLWQAFREASDIQKQTLAPLFAWLAAFAGVCLLHLGVPRLYVVSAWAALAMIFLIAGLRWNIGTFRAQSYVLFAVASFSCAAINLSESDKTDMVERIAGACVLIVLLFTAEFLVPRDIGGIKHRARVCFSFSAVILLTALLYHEVSGGLLTLVWGVEALTCLGCGFLARERVLRLQGLALFALCILKLFLYDLRHLEMLYRILSFTALGVILLGVPGCTRGSARRSAISIKQRSGWTTKACLQAWSEGSETRGWPVRTPTAERGNHLHVKAEPRVFETRSPLRFGAALW